MSTTIYNNPFSSTDIDRYEIWEMLVERDIKAFCNADWQMVANDFIEENFMGIDAKGLHNPDGWTIDFGDLESYKIEWLKQADQFSKTEWSENPEAGLLNAITLRDIEINGSSALLHKKFDGKIIKKGEGVEMLNWQTLYRCRKIDGQWKIAGFTGYLPHPMGQTLKSNIGKHVPETADQHVTAGPYSPVMEVTPGKLVVISGQASLDNKGAVIGDNIEEQTKHTLANCRKQLESGGCTLDDVFKVNVYLTDLGNWPRFNKVYETYFNDPMPVRTAVQTSLLFTLLVEIEMWAIKK